MVDPDLRAIWRQQGEAPQLPIVSDVIESEHQLSLNLVAQIGRTARREHRIFLILSAVGLMVLWLFGYYYVATALLLFALLMIWKYEAEMRLFRRIQPAGNTLEYLQAVRFLLRRFLRNYRIGILILIPLMMVSGTFFGQWLASGTLSWSLWQRPMTWLFLAVGIVGGILFSNLWLRFWVRTLYGQQLRTIEEMIDTLSKGSDADDE